MTKVEQTKHFSPQVKVFALLYLVYAAVCIFTFVLTRHQLHEALAWNLFLAFLPLLFSTLAVRPQQKKWSVAFWLILWLLFFPNAIYVMTDVIHLGELSFYGGRFYEVSQVVYVHDIKIWLELANTIIGVFLALIMGMLSALNVHEMIRKWVGNWKSWLIMLGVFIVSAGAIYVGRFLRFNSWDVIANPWKLITETWQNLDLFAWGYILLIAAFTVFIYVIFYQLLRLAKKL